MIIETKSQENLSNILIDDFSITAIQENTFGTIVWIYGNYNPINIIKPFKEMKVIFEQVKTRDRFTGEEKTKITKKISPTIKVDENEFCINIIQNEWDGQITKTLEVHANFKLKNDVLKQELEYILGVEKFNDFSFNKYQCSISIGKLFDADTIRKQVEEKFIEYLSL